jgi:hypothetical protein
MELKDFLKVATKRERAEVAIACNDSVSYLYQIAGNHRYASPILAVQIEKETQRVALTSSGRLEMVPRASMVRHPEIFSGLDNESLRSEFNGDSDDDSY